MRVTKLLIPMILALQTAATASPGPAYTGKLDLPASLKSERPVYARDIALALEGVVKTFTVWGFPVEASQLLTEVQVFDDLPSAKKALANHFSITPDQVPDTLSGTVDAQVMFLVTPPMYRANWTRLYPKHPWTTEQYRRLMTHELAHVAHARLSRQRFGDEDHMGPQWFFEGLACVVAGQFPGEPPLSRPELETLLGGKGKRTYIDYTRMVQALARKTPLPTLIRHAGDPDFPKPFVAKL